MHQLPKSVTRSQKRVGRGYGSGKGGHTSGRGQKGQKSRGSIPLIFEGRKMKKSLIKRFPFQRGKSKFKPWGNKPFAINLSDLAGWPVKTEVTLANLIKAGLVPEGTKTVKLLGKGKLAEKLTISIPTSAAVNKLVAPK
ncbi:MAG: 50S ribosomal protein L15 [bacterium]|nr:50S ribosomal protein L15 [bacterium]